MKNLLTDWKTWAAAALAAFVAFNEVAKVVDPGAQHTIVAVAAALGIVLATKTEAKVEDVKTEVRVQAEAQEARR